MMRGLLAIYGNVSWAAWRVWQRDVDVYRTTWYYNLLPPLLEPVLYVVAFGLGLGSLIGTVTYLDREMSYLSFMVPGVISVAIMFWAYFENTYASFVRMYYQRTFEAIVASVSINSSDRTIPPNGAAVTVVDVDSETHTASDTSGSIKLIVPPLVVDKSDSPDPVGAGDATAAALLHGVLRRWSWSRTIELANMLGAHVASQDGACPVLTAGIRKLAS